jgi:hypothetical protein
MRIEVGDSSPTNFVLTIRLAGTYVIAVGNRTDETVYLGKHRHRGQVTAHTLKGSWGYDEVRESSNKLLLVIDGCFLV